MLYLWCADEVRYTNHGYPNNLFWGKGLLFSTQRVSHVAQCPYFISYKMIKALFCLSSSINDHATIAVIIAYRKHGFSIANVSVVQLFWTFAILWWSMQNSQWLYNKEFYVFTWFRNIANHCAWWRMHASVYWAIVQVKAMTYCPLDPPEHTSVQFCFKMYLKMAYAKFINAPLWISTRGPSQ